MQKMFHVEQADSPFRLAVVRHDNKNVNSIGILRQMGGSSDDFLTKITDGIKIIQTHDVYLTFLN